MGRFQIEFLLCCVEPILEIYNFASPYIYPNQNDIHGCIPNIYIDTSSFAQVMAQTLAILHWKAGVDENDVEFILASAPLSTEMRADEID